MLQFDSRYAIVRQQLFLGELKSKAVFYWSYNKIMMNLSITGKKYTMPSVVPKMPDSLVIQSKPTTLKSTQSKTNVPRQKQPIQTKNKPATSKIISAQNKPNTKQAPPAKDSKKETKPVEPIKKEEQKQEETIKKQEAIVAVPKVEDKIGVVTVRYNHYKEKFETRNDILYFLPIQQKYCFSGVFKGNFIPVIKNFKTNQEINPETIGRAVEFSWKVEDQIQYRLQINQDQQQQAKYEKKPYIAPKSDKQACPFKKNSNIEYINEQLKKLKPEEYGSARHKELLQQRDLEDVLFS